MKKPKFNPSAPNFTLHHTGPGRPYANPLDYDQPYESMAEFSKLRNLRHDSNRTRHSYYRDMRLRHEHCGKDPATIIDGRVPQLHSPCQEREALTCLREEISKFRSFEQSPGDEFDLGITH